MFGWRSFSTACYWVIFVDIFEYTHPNCKFLRIREQNILCVLGCSEVLLYETRSKNLLSLDLKIYISLSRIQQSLSIMIHWSRRMPEDHSKKRIDYDPYAWVLFVFAAAAADQLDVQSECMCCDRGGLCVSLNSVFDVIPPEPDILEEKKLANC